MMGKNPAGCTPLSRHAHWGRRRSGIGCYLIQTDRFGTSVSQSLRIHSEDLRTKRRQRAEEMAAKTTIKMLFPLVFFVFPALFVVIMGPAVIRLYHMFVEPK